VAAHTISVYRQYLLLTADVTSYKEVRATQAAAEVRGLALLHGRLCVVRKHSSQIEVVDPVTLTLLSNIGVSSMKNACSMAACPLQNSIYVTCFEDKAVLKISVAGLSVCVSGNLAWICRIFHIHCTFTSSPYSCPVPLSVGG